MLSSMIDQNPPVIFLLPLCTNKFASMQYFSDAGGFGNISRRIMDCILFDRVMIGGKCYYKNIQM